MTTATIKMQPCASSRIAEYGYDEASRTLAVRFQAKAGPGSLYHYADVPPDVFAALCKSESKGKFVGSAIVKGGFAYTKIVEEKPETKEPA